MEGPLYRLLIWFRCVHKIDPYRQLLFLVGRIKKKLFIWNRLAKWTNIGRKHQWKVLYKDCSFCPDLVTNMIPIGNSCFWLVNFKKSSLKSLGQIKRTFNGSIYGRSSIRLPHAIAIGLKTWSPWTILVSDWLKLKKCSPLKLECTMNCYFAPLMHGRFCTIFYISYRPYN